MTRLSPQTAYNYTATYTQICTSDSWMAGLNDSSNCFWSLRNYHIVPAENSAVFPVVREFYKLAKSWLPWQCMCTIFTLKIAWTCTCVSVSYWQSILRNVIRLALTSSKPAQQTHFQPMQQWPILLYRITINIATAWPVRQCGRVDAIGPTRYSISHRLCMPSAVNTAWHRASYLTWSLKPSTLAVTCDFKYYYPITCVIPVYHTCQL